MRVGEDVDLGEPEALRRPGGESAYTVHGSATYTSTRILDAERRLLDLAGRADGRVIGEGRIRLAVADAAKDGITLDPSQAEMVRRLATSGSRLQVALAPAGSGKTTALAVLTRAWKDSGGTVIGLAPTAVAAEQLGKATGAWSDTLAKLVHELASAAADPNPPVRTIAAIFAAEIGPRTLVLVDEAAMAGTADLAAVVSYAIGRGASVRLVGDDQQLGAVAAGGVFRDLADLGHLHGTTVRLTELHRFTDPAEGAATLGVRDGDPAALDFYVDHGRVHAGDVESVADEAYAAWRADVAAGRSSLLLAPTRDMVRELNERAREDRLAGLGGPAGREARLADGTRASRGDVVITRQNDRRLRTPGGTWVKNGDRWTVLDVDAAGAATVERLGRHRARPGARIVLPAAYVREHLQLGYASTIHGAQGATVDTTHTVLTGTEDRQSLYVAVSRGRHENHVYVGSPAARLDGIGLDPETSPVEARDVLAAILERDGRPRVGHHHAARRRGRRASRRRPALPGRDTCPRPAGAWRGPDARAGRGARSLVSGDHVAAGIPGSAWPDRRAMGRWGQPHRGGPLCDVDRREGEAGWGGRPGGRRGPGGRRRRRAVRRWAASVAVIHPAGGARRSGSRRLPREGRRSHRRAQGARDRRRPPAERRGEHAVAARPPRRRRPPPRRRPCRLAGC